LLRTSRQRGEPGVMPGACRCGTEIMVAPRAVRRVRWDGETSGVVRMRRGKSWVVRVVGSWRRE